MFEFLAGYAFGALNLLPTLLAWIASLFGNVQG